MTQPSHYVEGLQFGKVSSPNWQVPAGATPAGLTAAVIQHVHAAKVVAALHARQMTRISYAAAIGRGSSAVSKCLGGQREMRASDIADAVTCFGLDVLPTQKDLKSELTRARSMTGLT